MPEIYYNENGQAITRERLKRTKQVDIITLIDYEMSEQEAADHGALPPEQAEILLAEWLEQWANHIRINDDYTNNNIWVLEITCPGHVALKLNESIWTIESKAVEAEFIEI